MLVTRVAVYDARQFSARQREALATSLTLQADLYAQLVNGSAPPPHTEVGLLEDAPLSALPGRGRG